MTAVQSAPSQSTSSTEPFVLDLVRGDRHSEAPATLAEPVPQSLGLLDQMGLWGNLGVSLLGFTGALFVLEPIGPSIAPIAALLAIVLGSIAGTVVLGLVGIPSARSGAPAMMTLRGLFGAKLSYLPTALNILQCLGWGVFEIITIATAGHFVASWAPRWVLVLLAGIITMGLTIRPLGSIRVLRKYVTAVVVVVLIYLLIEMLRHPIHHFTGGTWSGFWIALDTVVGATVSFVPLAGDYTRHSRSPRTAFAGVFFGYSVTQILCYGIGMLALLTVAQKTDDVYGAFIAVPVGTLCFAVLAIRELDQSFANVYSTAVSVQNLRPLWDRRVLAGIIGVITTVLALSVGVRGYENFLILLGAVFVPLAGTLIVDYFLLAGRRWNLSADSPARWSMLIPWVVGFITYQLINPGYVGWWSRAWQHLDTDIHFTVQTWMSASILSFAVACIVTLLVSVPGLVLTRRRTAHAAA